MVRKIGYMIIVFWLGVLASAAYSATQFRIIVDASGSMMISDPDRLTAQSLKLIADLAPDQESTLGVWLFGEQARVLLPEAPIDVALRQRLSNYVDNFQTEDLSTDLESVLKLLLATADTPLKSAPEWQRHWILVTDGMVDISLDDKVNDASIARIEGGLARQLEERGVKLHTVSMTGYTNKDLLQSLSRKTSASHTEIASPEDLLPTFNKIFSQATIADQLPLEGNRFFVDESVQEFTLLVFHRPEQTPVLIRPNNEPLDVRNAPMLKVAKGSHYTLMTILAPAIGTWRLEGVDAQKSTVRVITNLTARASMVPAVLFVNEPFSHTIGVFQDQAPLTAEDVLALVEVNQSLLDQDGDLSTPIAQTVPVLVSGQFKNNFTGLPKQGDYALLSTLDGKSFVRQIPQYFSVYDPVEFDVSLAENDMVTYTAKPTHVRLNLLNSEAFLQFIYADGRQEEQPIRVIGQGYWQAMAPANADEYLVRVRLNAVTQAGTAFDFMSPSWRINRALDIAVPSSEDSELVPVESSLVEDVLPMDNMFIPPSLVSVVVPDNQTANDLPEQVEQDPQTTQLTPDSVPELTLTTTEILLYVALNSVAVLLVAGLIWWYRRRRSVFNEKGGEQDV